MSNVTVYAPDGTPIITANGSGGGGGAQGAQGTQGRNGFQGTQGTLGTAGNTAGIRYQFDVTTTGPPSTNGRLRYNSATLASITLLYIAANSLDAGTTIWNFAETWGTSTNPNDKGYLTITNDSTSTWGRVNIFRITGPAVASSSPDPVPPAGGSYYTVPVVYVGGALNVPQGNTNITITYTRTGNQGIQGVQGTQGFGYAQLQGTQGTQGLQGAQGVQGVAGAGFAQLQGTQGAQGIQGSGTVGSQGTQGISGANGSQGIQGTIGTGIQGIQGTQGLIGIQGNNGTQGVQGPPGTGVTSISTDSPITGGPITTTGTIGITQADFMHDGYLSSTDWNTFNNKQDVVTRQHEFITGSPTSIDYNGHAPLGSTQGDPVWTIYKLEISQDGTSIFYHADGNPTVKWDDRASITYSV